MLNVLTETVAVTVLRRLQIGSIKGTVASLPSETGEGESCTYICPLNIPLHPRDLAQLIRGHKICSTSKAH